MRLAEIHRYPVKSMQGERLMGAVLGEQGIPGDRAWALRDESRGGLTGAKKFPDLMAMRARLAAEPGPGMPSPEVQIDTGDGTLVSTASHRVDAVLSGALGHPVTLWPLLSADHVEHYRREAPAAGDQTEALRALFGRTEDEPLPDLSRFPEALATHHTPPGTYFDAYPLLIMTRSSLCAIADRAAATGFDSKFDLRRFRPNLLIDTADEGFVENGWVGRTLTIGEAEIRVEMTCPRCIMTTHGFDDLPRDPKVMRALVQHNGGDLGVYASITHPGRISAGDPVVLT